MNGRSRTRSSVYYVFFKGLIVTGRDVIFLDMSRKMSVSFANAEKAAAQIRDEYPGRKPM